MREIRAACFLARRLSIVDFKRGCFGQIQDIGMKDSVLNSPITWQKKCTWNFNGGLVVSFIGIFVPAKSLKNKTR